MRRLYVSVVLGVCLQAAFAEPAHAWFGWFDRLSGPGPFKGLQLEARLVCFGPSVQFTSTVVESACPDPPEDTPAKRRASINLEFRSLHYTDESRQYAGGHEIGLTTIEPTFAWSVLSGSRKYDVVDVVTGGGMYWFSSEGFDSFHGLIVEPARFDLHAPWIVRRHAWAALIPVYRIGWAWFPAGFPADAFAATGTAAHRIEGGHTSFTQGLFVDLEPLVRQLRDSK